MSITLHGRRFSISRNTSFTLASGATTSSGVYLKNTDIKIRNLWDAIYYPAGSHRIYWDYNDDFGNRVSDGEYDVRVLKHNVEFTWEGVSPACNNSIDATGPGVYAWFAPISCMVQVGNYVYTGFPFSEGVLAQAKFHKDSPRVCVRFQQPGLTGQASLYACANSNYIFFAGRDYYGTDYYTIAFNTSNEQLSVFTNGVSYTPPNGITYPSTLGLNTTGGYITGIACTEKYLFISYKSLNIIKVYQVDDGSGSFVRNISITAPINLFSDGTNLYIAQSTTVKKYPINTDGTLGTLIYTISSLEDVKGLSVYSSDLAIFDAGNQQVIKRYNSSTGAPTTVIGTVGGYAGSPDITPYKFNSNSLNRLGVPYIYHQSDGSIWYGDCSTLRHLHFGSNGVYLGDDSSIIYLPATYEAAPVLGTSDRLITNILEYDIDPTQPMSTRLTISKDWTYYYPDSVDGHSTLRGLGSFSGIVKLSNGKTYGIGNASGAYSYIFELTATGFREIAGSNSLVPQFSQLGSDGDMYNFSGVGHTTTFFKYPFKQFNTVGEYQNPEWDLNNPVTLATIDSGDAYPANFPDRLYKTTDNGNLFVFEIYQNSTQTFNVGFWRDGVWRSGNLKSTIDHYGGDWVYNAFDRWNNVNYPGGPCVAIGPYVVFAYRGENWKSGQTSKYFVYHESGLLIDTVGVVQAQFLDTEQPAYGYSTNILDLVPYYDEVSGRAYWMMNGENGHSLQSWLMENIDSVSIQNVPIVVSGIPLPPPSPPGVDLLFGMPNFATNVSNAGMTRSPSSDNAHIITTTRKYQNDMNKSADLLISVDGGVGVNYSTMFDLPYDGSKPNWVVSGNLFLVGAFIGSEASGHEKAYYSIKDTDGKDIFIIYFYQTGRISVNENFYGPVGPAYPNCNFIVRKSGSQVYWSLDIFAQTYSGTVALADPTANINAPSKINFDVDFTSFATNCKIGIVELYYNES